MPFLALAAPAPPQAEPQARLPGRREAAEVGPRPAVGGGRRLAGGHQPVADVGRAAEASLVPGRELPVAVRAGRAHQPDAAAGLLVGAGAGRAPDADHEWDRGEHSADRVRAPRHALRSHLMITGADRSDNANIEDAEKADSDNDTSTAFC